MHVCGLVIHHGSDTESSKAGDRFNAEQKRLGGDRAGRVSRIAQERLRDIRK